MDNGFHLHTVGSNVLDGRGADFSWNIRQVFRPVIIIPSHLGAEVVPHHARTHAEQDVLVVARNLFDEFDVGMQYCAFKILGKQQVASAADVQDPFTAFSECIQNLNQFIHRFVADELLCLHIHREGVVLEQ